MEEKVERLRKAIEVKMITPEGSGRVPSGFYITAKSDPQGALNRSARDPLHVYG